MSPYRTTTVIELLAELSSRRAAQSKHHLQTVQTIAEGTPFREA